MADNLKKTGKADDIRINVNQDHELAYWSNKFNVSRIILKLAVQEAGVMAEDVEEWIQKNAKGC